MRLVEAEGEGRGMLGIVVAVAAGCGGISHDWESEVWMRHLVLAAGVPGPDAPQTVPSYTPSERVRERADQRHSI
jgi:hypothetical protein